jgi:hypothetical protein
LLRQDIQVKFYQYALEIANGIMLKRYGKMYLNPGNVVWFIRMVMVHMLIIFRPGSIALVKNLMVALALPRE